MFHRMILVILSLAFAFSLSTLAGAANTTTVKGTVTSKTTPSFAAKPGYLVVRLFRGSDEIDEIGRYDQHLPASGPPYSFSFEVDNARLNLPGPLNLKASIVNEQRYIYYQTKSLVPYTRGTSGSITLSVDEVPRQGTQYLPGGSAGTLLVLVGVVSVILAVGIALWRRRRSRVLTRRFA